MKLTINKIEEILETKINLVHRKYADAAIRLEKINSDDIRKIKGNHGEISHLESTLSSMTGKLYSFNIHGKQFYNLICSNDIKFEDFTGIVENKTGAFSDSTSRNPNVLISIPFSFLNTTYQLHIHFNDSSGIDAGTIMTNDRILRFHLDAEKCNKVFNKLPQDLQRDTILTLEGAISKWEKEGKAYYEHYDEISNGYDASY